MFRVICAMVTPFNSCNGPIDHAWVPLQLRFLQHQGIDGVLILGTTGEGGSLGLEERKQLIDTVMEHRGDLSVLVSSGSSVLTETIELSRYALERGADALLLIPPFYFRNVAEHGVLQYYRAVCDAFPAQARLLLYHVPQISGIALTPAIIDGLLASHPHQLMGIKDSSGDPQHTAALVQRYPHLQMYSGSDSQAAPSLAAGASGMVSALANGWPDLVQAVFLAHQQGGDTEKAQARLSAVRQALRPFVLIPAIKAAVGQRDDCWPTSVRLPLQNLTEAEMALLCTALQMLEP
ncbi:MAG: dihydrodipicolinate synthase family protein [Chloroflexaceae bacterium]|nr:dihydrodipicolinate synthase family protein [Chloroflexaceae bacterium]